MSKLFKTLFVISLIGAMVLALVAVQLTYFDKSKKNAARKKYFNTQTKSSHSF